MATPQTDRLEDLEILFRALGDRTRLGELDEEFVAGVGSAAVMVNASTRFTDGGQLGLGAEIGISTQKLHARGPMGLRQLTTEKFVVRGTGQTRG